MKTLQLIVMALASAAAINACASIPLEARMAQEYRCIGVGKVDSGEIRKNPSLAMNIARNRAIANYQQRCRGRKVGSMSEINVTYDPYRQVVVAYDPSDKL